MVALARRVPLTLLLDLAAPEGPESTRILTRETADLSWLAGLSGSVAPEATSLDEETSAAG